MAESNRCPQCGTDVPGDAPQGLCPNCLLKAGFATEPTQSVWQTGGKCRGPFLQRPLHAAHAGRTGRPFPDLEIMALVGRGGMGVVYKARQKRFDRMVA